MACKGAKHAKALAEASRVVAVQPKTKTAEEAVSVERLLFGVDSEIQANDILQNNISMFEWVIRNKVHPNFWGRNLLGVNALTKDEIDFIHSKGCKIAAVYNGSGDKQTEKQGKSAGEIAEKFSLSGATVSYHLAKLKGADLIAEEKYKNFIYYSLNASVFEEVLVWMYSLGGEKK